jgi:hypothetical protein
LEDKSDEEEMKDMSEDEPRFESPKAVEIQEQEDELTDELVLY